MKHKKKRIKQEFNLSNYMFGYVMHCNTLDKAKKFCAYLHEHNKTWKSKTPYTTKHFYEVNQRNTCYNFARGKFSSKSYYENETSLKVLSFDDFVWN